MKFLFEIWQWVVSWFAPKRTIIIQDINETINKGLVSSEKITVRYKGGKMFKNYQSNCFKNL